MTLKLCPSEKYDLRECQWDLKYSLNWQIDLCWSSSLHFLCIRLLKDENSHFSLLWCDFLLLLSELNLLSNSLSLSPSLHLLTSSWLNFDDVLQRDRSWSCSVNLELSSDKIASTFSIITSAVMSFTCCCSLSSSLTSFFCCCLFWLREFFDEALKWCEDRL